MILLLTSTISRAKEAVSNNTNISYKALLAGFLIVFTAGFCFSYVVKILLQYKNPEKSRQQILRSSLLTGFLIALLVLLILYGTLV
jgi:amino acid transporter